VKSEHRFVRWVACITLWPSIGVGCGVCAARGQGVGVQVPEAFRQGDLESLLEATPDLCEVCRLRVQSAFELAEAASAEAIAAHREVVTALREEWHSGKTRTEEDNRKTRRAVAIRRCEHASINQSMWSAMTPRGACCEHLGESMKEWFRRWRFDAMARPGRTRRCDAHEDYSTVPDIRALLDMLEEEDPESWQVLDRRYPPGDDQEITIRQLADQLAIDAEISADHAIVTRYPAWVNLAVDRGNAVMEGDCDLVEALVEESRCFGWGERIFSPIVEAAVEIEEVLVSEGAILQARAFEAAFSKALRPESARRGMLELVEWELGSLELSADAFDVASDLVDRAIEVGDQYREVLARSNPDEQWLQSSLALGCSDRWPVDDQDLSPGVSGFHWAPGRHAEPPVGPRKRAMEAWAAEHASLWSEFISILEPLQWERLRNQLTPLGYTGGEPRFYVEAMDAMVITFYRNRSDKGLQDDGLEH